MTDKSFQDMAHATRLTRAGKLAEATALIQRLLRGEASSAACRTGPATLIEGDSVTMDPAAPQAAHPAPEFSRPDARPRMGLGETLRSLAARRMPASLDIGISGVPQPAPDPLPDGASFTTESYANAAGTRDYKLYVPANRAGQRLPLIVMLHGCTQSPDDFAAGTRMNALAEEHGFLVAYPDQPASANAQKCWNWFSPSDQRRDRGEPSLIAGITQRIMRDHPVDASRVYIAGLSAGGAAAATMGDAYPDLYAAVGVHSGLPTGAARDLPSAFSAMRQGAPGAGRRSRFVPTIVFHGDRDETVHPRNGNAVAAQSTASANGLSSTVQRGQSPTGHAYSRMVYADASGGTLCEQWTIHGAGHAWAGGSSSGSFTDPRGPDASREMLRFFLEHRHASARIL
jgi:poly(hydroxyalkanoate) depolymerase family esterase